MSELYRDTPKPGDVVYVDGVSAILGDVQEVDLDEDMVRVTVKWRETVTTEDAVDLVLVTE